MESVHPMVQRAGDLVGDLSRLCENMDKAFRDNEASAERLDDVMVQLDNAQRKLKSTQEEVATLEAKKAKLTSDIEAIRARLG
jgi:predicted  nucleic acid-binding Zn-ribbon protein